MMPILLREMLRVLSEMQIQLMVRTIGELDAAAATGIGGAAAAGIAATAIRGQGQTMRQRNRVESGGTTAAAVAAATAGVLVGLGTSECAAGALKEGATEGEAGAPTNLAGTAEEITR